MVYLTFLNEIKNRLTLILVQESLVGKKKKSKPSGIQNLYEQTLD
jgi:hypothetical protein